MTDLLDGETVEIKGSAAKPYVISNTGGVYWCTCPAWRNQSAPIDQRTCKHLRLQRGDAQEQGRIGSTLAAARPTAAKADAPGLLLADTWDGSRDVAGWWLSEKLDGVRALWDGKRFVSRLGNMYLAPEWFAAGLPESPLDGELWIGRGAFQRTVSIVRRADRGDLWKEVRYLVFDAPSAPGGFEERLSFLRATLGPDRECRYAQVLEQRPCAGVEDLHAQLARVEELGGEGLMLRQPGSFYEVGRSATLLKVKTFLDAEAIVVGHVPGAGKHSGRLGALELQMPDGTRFSCGTGLSDEERRNPPPVGAVVSYRYQELTDAGVPRFPSYIGQRMDVAPPTITTTATAAASVEVAQDPVAAVVTVRRFEFIEGTSRKFWEIEVSGPTHSVCFGRIGSRGQSATKSFADAVAADRAAQKLIAEKTAKGYREVSRP